MRSLKFHGNKVLSIDDVPTPIPQSDEVLIRTAVSAICGSEMGCYRGNGQESGNPGHEAAGTIIALGPEVKNLMIGQRVGVSAIAGCGHCIHCDKGESTWCAERRFYGNMHAEQFIAAETACHVLPDDISWVSGVLITGDGFGVPYHSSTKIISPDARTVAIFGAGPIGLGNIIMQKHLGRNVLAVDMSPERLNFAKQFGADILLNPTEYDVLEEIKKWTNGHGADICIEAAGRQETVRSCFAAVRSGGQIIFNGEQGRIEFSISEDFIRRDITATGSWFYQFHEFDAMLELYRSGLNVSQLISDRFPFEEAVKAYEKFSGGKSAKVLLYY
ncbi:MAG: zinc-binding dehydrogenase [Victivallales bacterium]|jgi:threonine dehydrogenase-like Zn-dependent dehydrogenase|nr:zinc-binding dehydrogenase [Victivallales bacterium]